MNILVERHVEPTLLSSIGHEKNGVTDFFTGSRLSPNLGPGIVSHGHTLKPTVRIIYSSSPEL